MSALNEKRMLSLRFEGEAIREHAISVHLFSKSLISVQSLLIHLAESRLEKEFRARGRSDAAIAAECELFLQPVEANCVTATLTLPEKDESLFPELPDLGENVLEDARNSFTHFSEGEYAPIESICPDPRYRRHVLNVLNSVAPSKKSDYNISFIGNDNHRHYLVKPPKDKLNEMLKVTEQAIPHISTETAEPKLVSAKGMAIVDDGNIIE